MTLDSSKVCVHNHVRQKRIPLQIILTIKIGDIHIIKISIHSQEIPRHTLFLL